jgi:dCMP deaminase
LEELEMSNGFTGEGEIYVGPYRGKLVIKEEYEREQQEKWDRRFMDVAKLVSTWSKDPSSQIGAVLVKDRRILASGYNGFPRGIEDDERLDVREKKYPLVVHAEMNVLMNALEAGISARGATLYVYGLPICKECAKNILNSGIVRVVIGDPSECPRDDWSARWVFESEPIFREASHIKLAYLKGYYGS